MAGKEEAHAALHGIPGFPGTIGIVFAATLIEASAQSATDGSAACPESQASKTSPNDPSVMVS